MAEDEAGDNDETLTDLADADIRTGIYEGGFKTWECAVDLASLLLDRGPRKDIDELERVGVVVEVRVFPNNLTDEGGGRLLTNDNSSAAALLSQPSHSSNTPSKTPSP
jgi:hypothetical protein